MEIGSDTAGKQVAVADSSRAAQKGQKSDVGTSSRNAVVLQTPRSNSSQSLVRSRRRNMAGAPKVSGAARLSRSSRTPAGSSDVSSLPNEKSKHDTDDNTNSDSHASSPDSHRLPLVNPHTPLPPYRTKARQSTTEDSSIASNMPNTSTPVASLTHPACARDAREDVGTGDHPAFEEEPGFGTEGDHSTDSTKTGSEYSTAETEVESLASSKLTDPGDSVPEELVSSECSSSVEFCLDDPRDVGGSATRMNVVAQMGKVHSLFQWCMRNLTRFAGEPVNTSVECSGVLPALAHTADDTQHSKPTSQSVSSQAHASSASVPVPSSTASPKQPTSVSSGPVSHVEDESGRVTNRQSPVTDKPSEAQSIQKQEVISREDKASVDSEKASKPDHSPQGTPQNIFICV
jgi:hypothetical protein